MWFYLIFLIILLIYVDVKQYHFIKMNMKSNKTKVCGLKGEDGGDDGLTTRHNTAWEVNIEGGRHKIRDDGKQPINKEGRDDNKYKGNSKGQQATTWMTWNNEVTRKKARNNGQQFLKTMNL
jgi:hypothetical protein